MIVAVIVVRMMQAPIDQIVDVVAMRHSLVLAPIVVRVIHTLGRLRMTVRMLGIHRDHVLVNVISMWVVKMAFMEIVDVIVVAHRHMTATIAVDVGVFTLVSGVRHEAERTGRCRQRPNGWPWDPFLVESPTVRPRGLEPPRELSPTRPSTLRVYQFRHRRRGDASIDLTSRAADLRRKPVRERSGRGSAQRWPPVRRRARPLPRAGLQPPRLSPSASPATFPNMCSTYCDGGPNEQGADGWT